MNNNLLNGGDGDDDGGNTSQPFKSDSLFTDNLGLDISGILSHTIDGQKLIDEVKNAEKLHPFTRRTIHWLSIPLRSVNGDISEEASSAHGIWNSSDPNMFKDTPMMQPYIRSILDEINSPLLKVRILKLISKKAIGEHADSFQSDDILRLHIPIITHPSVEFWVDGKQFFIEPQTLSYLNVKKRHKVINKSNIDRIHLVFDVKETPELVERIKKCAKQIKPKNDD
jgi:hypothetical protein